MASVNSLDRAVDLEPRELPARRLLAGLATWWAAIREGSAAAHDYDTLVRRGVPHEKAVQRVFEEHFRG